jgi:hypothetical protein
VTLTVNRPEGSPGKSTKAAFQSERGLRRSKGGGFCHGCRWVLVGLALIGCGAESEGPSKVELEAMIEAEIEALNSCETIDDCSATVGYPRCRAQWINGDADRTHLDELLEDYYAGEEISCDASCQCALLRCEEGTCTLSSGDCMVAPPGAIATCF